jgi:hypothetical protein
MFKKNSYLAGALAGLLIPCVFYGILFGLNALTNLFFQSVSMLPLNKMLFASAALNILPIRYCFVKDNLQKTGQGVLLVTVFLVVIITLAF